MGAVEISDESLSRWIAEKLEPMPNDTPDEVAVLDEWPLSNGKNWQLVSSYGEGDVLHWEPRNMVTDPAMTVMLLEKMGTAELEPDLSYENGCWHVYTLRDVGPQFVDFSRKLKIGRAVAEAWAIANGFQEVR
jgi:hypothetical protein